ncbi:hypothetical protein [Bacillus sp. T33-2]|uniref:hypothetical protein n=1 Tax=Bacillus sp. T33-2 TaxID=2054168 RepID=UPI000C759BC0|nr:hypothetical protein [Bacillus sp. T33-2]PLR96367.1 hypothetical protein CVD19_11840 [Bacillus sp. T33-2]
MIDEREKKTMNERIRAFYQQSGGPNNPQISRIIEKHLLDGKDHGAPGKRESFKDAMLEVFLDDYTTKDIILWLLKTKYDISDRWQELVSGRTNQFVAVAAEEPQPDESRLNKLEDRLLRLETSIEKIVHYLETNEPSKHEAENQTQKAAIKRRRI